MDRKRANNESAHRADIKRLSQFHGQFVVIAWLAAAHEQGNLKFDALCAPAVLSNCVFDTVLKRNIFLRHSLPQF